MYISIFICSACDTKNCSKKLRKLNVSAMTNDVLQISSGLSTMFLIDFELPALSDVKKLISCKHKENRSFDNGLDSLTDILCALLLQKTQFLKISHSGQDKASDTFSKRYDYQGELPDKNATLAVIELVLQQEDLLSRENVQTIVDHLKCVVLFKSTKRLRWVFDFIREVFEYITYEFDDELLVPSEERKKTNDTIFKMRRSLDEVDRNFTIRSWQVPDFHEAEERFHDCQYGCDVFDD